MIQQPPSYKDYCRKFNTLTPVTMFNMRDKEADRCPCFYRYQVGDTNIPGTLKGRIELLYVLKSFPKEHDNSRYQVFVISPRALYAEEVTHSEIEEPLNFRSMFLRFIEPFGYSGHLGINVPNTRKIMFLKNYTWKEKIDDKVYPNSFDSRDVEPKSSHKILIKAPQYKDIIEVDFTPTLYEALRHNLSYLHLRRDNYVDFSNIKPYLPRY